MLLDKNWLVSSEQVNFFNLVSGYCNFFTERRAWHEFWNVLELIWVQFENLDASISSIISEEKTLLLPEFICGRLPCRNAYSSAERE